MSHEKVEIITPKHCNEEIFNIVKNEINNYESISEATYGCDSAKFSIFDNFFHELYSNPIVSERSGIKLINIIKNTLVYDYFSIASDAGNREGVGFIIEFDNKQYSLRFKSFRDNNDMIYQITVKNNTRSVYPPIFIHQYLLYNALETSQLKGAYFTMPRNEFSWDLKTLEKRDFEDIYLPDGTMEDLKLYVQIFEKENIILNYLKVGPPGVGKTESSLVLANELNKKGVTVIKTVICETLHRKMELARVLAPSLLIFDDIDLSLGDRNSGGFSSMLGDFLDVLDGTDKMAKNVGIIATTNAAHLLDLAAQRPGRFDKILLYDNISKANIKKLILKSLKSSFQLDGTCNECQIYSDDKIVLKFFNAKVTGAHIYNAIKMLKLRYDTLGIQPTVEKIISDINDEIKVIDKLRESSKIKDRMDGHRKNSIGFSNDRADLDNWNTEETTYPREIGFR